jgi:DNA polymerase III alpha subunit (gram-positive type)
MQAFQTWLTEHNPTKRSVILLAHNGYQFDFRLLTNEMKRHSLDHTDLYQSLNIHRVCDTLVHLRKGMKKPQHELRSFRLGNMYQQVKGCKLECAHTALADAKAVFELFIHLQILGKLDCVEDTIDRQSYCKDIEEKDKNRANARPKLKKRKRSSSIQKRTANVNTTVIDTCPFPALGLTG